MGAPIGFIDQMDIPPGAVPALSQDTGRQAALTICDRARDRGDAEQLLDICGLRQPRPAPASAPVAAPAAAVDLTPVIAVLAEAMNEQPRRRCRGCGYLRSRCACPGKGIR